MTDVRRPSPPPASTDPTPTSNMVRPSREDPVVGGLVEAVGGAPGRHARTGSQSYWTPVRVVLALACVLLAACWVQKAPCRTAVWQHEYQYSHTCYTDVFALYYSEGLSTGAVPYLDHDVEYPVLTGALMEVVAVPARAIGYEPGRAFFDLTALVLAGCALATVVMVVRLRRRRPWDAAMLALAPAVVVTAYVNWDLFAVALATGSLLAWARRRPVLAGVLLGLAVAAKFYPLLFLGPLLLLCLRSKQMQAFWLCTGGAVLAWLVVNLPVIFVAPHAWGTFFRLSQSRGADWGTLWYWVQQLRGGRALDSGVGTPSVLNAAEAVLLVIACLGIGLLALAARRRPRLASLLFLVVAAFLLTGKVWSQQYVLWLVPLAVLARPRWRAFLVWQVCELAYFLAFYYELVGAARGAPVIPEWVFIRATWLRAGGLAVLCVLVVIDVLRPAGDAVRAYGDDDPAGGVLDGAPDVLGPQPSGPGPSAVEAVDPVVAGDELPGQR